jgi:FAD/FMN-containing dehydrogenase
VRVAVRFERRKDQGPFCRFAGRSFVVSSNGAEHALVAASSSAHLAAPRKPGKERNVLDVNTSLDKLQAAVSGRITLPADPGFDEAREVALGGIDKRPAAIVRVRDAADIARVIAFARDNGLELAVRNGGHSGAGHSSTEGGIVIDVRGLTGIDIDIPGRTVWAGAGLTALELAGETLKDDLIVGFGDAGSVGIGGITLGGGVGYLSRKLGLTIDSLLAAEIVTADGKVHTVDERNEADLFWAIRGGGGNFGVVTRLKYKLSPLPEFTGGMLVLPATAETVAGFVSAASAAPEELGTIANVMPAPPMPFLPPDAAGKPVILAFIAYAGDPASAERALAPFRALGTPLADMVKPQSYLSMFPPEDPDYKPVAVGRTLFTDAIGVSEAQEIIDAVTNSGAPFAAVQIRVLGGAIGRVPDAATAYGHRHEKIMAMVVSFSDGTPETAKQRAEWAETLAGELNPNWSAGYVNFLFDEGAERVRAAYPGSTWDRLRETKKRYDPQNLFRLNHNIPPAE